MRRPQRAAALLSAFILTGCAGFIPQGAEPVSGPPPTTGDVPVRTPQPRPTAPAASQSLPPLPPPDYRYEPTPLLQYSVPAAPGENALGLGVRAGPPVSSLLAEVDATRAFHAFRITCPAVINREDRSGLTGAHDWVEACRAAADWNGDPARFFAQHFRSVQVGGGEAFATGYYEPEIAASRERRAGYDWPIYGRPSDLLERPQTRGSDVSDLPRVYRSVDGEPTAYFDRAEIESGALAGRGLEIAWARDIVDLFFLQVQGSGMLRLPDGSALRIGYAGNNGYDYTSIGRLMLDRGLLEPGQATAQGIQAWLRAHPDEAREIMQANRRYIFFEASRNPAPNGSLGHYVTPRATVAADPAYVPLGAPVFLDVHQDVADGLWVAQDTGGAIRGPNRFDTFWGAGESALAIAGGMAGRGRAYVLIPLASAERLGL